MRAIDAIHVTAMIFLCTDYLRNLYSGQIQACIAGIDSQIPVINAIDDLPAFDIHASAYLLHALIRYYPEKSIILGIVDPGVGGDRSAICLGCENRMLVGPDNGLFSRIIQSTLESVQIFALPEPAEPISSTFHGRDLFAPAAVELLRSGGDCSAYRLLEDSETKRLAAQWPLNLNQVIYVDGFGNCVTGVSGASIDKQTLVHFGANSVSYAETFCALPPSEAFWHVNSIGLVEIAMNQGSAASRYNLCIGSNVHLN